MTITQPLTLRLALAAVAVIRRPALAAARGLHRGSVERLLRQHQVPLAALAILQDGAVVETFTYDIIHSRSHPRVDRDTRFQAASLSKTFNALLVLTLARDNLIGLDDPVNKRLVSCQLPVASAVNVTIPPLLSHTAHINVEGFPVYYRTDDLPTLREILDGRGLSNTDAIEITRKINSYAYSRGGVEILHQIVIHVTRQPYDAVVQARVL